MKAINRANILLKYSDIDFVSQLKKFKVSKRINWLRVVNYTELSIGDVIKIWDISNNNQLIEVTKQIFLLNTWYKRLYYRIFVRNDENLKLIDFSRLVINTQDVGEHVAKKFESIKPLYSDERIKDIAAKYKGESSDMIARFCKLYPAYTIETAMKVGWYDVYLAFKNDTQQNNIQVEYSKLIQNDNRN